MAKVTCHFNKERVWFSERQLHNPQYSGRYTHNVNIDGVIYVCVLDYQGIGNIKTKTGEKSVYFYKEIESYVTNELLENRTVREIILENKKKKSETVETE